MNMITQLVFFSDQNIFRLCGTPLRWCHVDRMLIEHCLQKMNKQPPLVSNWNIFLIFFQKPLYLNIDSHLRCQIQLNLLYSHM